MGIFKWITSFFSSPAPIVEVKTAPAPKKVVKAEAPKKAVKKTVEPKVAKLTKASLSKLTKAQIEAEGKKFGIDVDKRKTKDVIISEVIAASKKA
jgi:hypothetical protein|tara:strand:- start:231 stop:515 length:285 start_codon:yes stop_codon:yes gene_type:complete